MAEAVPETTILPRAPSSQPLFQAVEKDPLSPSVVKPSRGRVHFSIAWKLSRYWRTEEEELAQVYMPLYGHKFFFCGFLVQVYVDISSCFFCGFLVQVYMDITSCFFYSLFRCRSTNCMCMCVVLHQGPIRVDFESQMKLTSK